MDNLEEKSIRGRLELAKTRRTGFSVLQAFHLSKKYARVRRIKAPGNVLGESEIPDDITLGGRIMELSYCTSPFEHLAGVSVLRGDHLREIDQRQPLLIVHQYVEFVEITVNETVPRQANDHLHALLVHLVRVSHLPTPQLVHGVSLRVAHEDDMSATEKPRNHSLTFFS